MRSLLLVSAALLAACSTTAAPTSAAPPDAIPVRGETPGHTCNAANAHRYIGQPRTDETGEAIKRATNAAVLRWAPPGLMLTMDYRGDRVTVRVGPNGKITQINCG